MYYNFLIKALYYCPTGNIVEIYFVWKFGVYSVIVTFEILSRVKQYFLF